jgi:hypothetical protein
MTTSLLRLFCFTGLSLIGLGVGLSAALYRGKQGEKFSGFNHFISELGERGVSRAARLFNTGLVAGGMIILPYIVGLGIRFGSVLGWLGMVSGLAATFGVIGVGLFPMNNISAHVKAATLYFRAGLVMVSLYGLAILFQPAHAQVVPQAANVLSLPAFGAYAAFLLIVRPSPLTNAGETVALDPTEKPQRPRIWLFPILEWLVFFFTLFWLFGMAFFL